MIKIYIFVTGLVLYQLAMTPGGTNYAILAAGNFDYPDLATIGEHTAKIYSGTSTAGISLTEPLEVELGVPCPDGGCVTRVGDLESIPALADLVEKPKIDPACLVFGGGASCHPRGSTKAGRNGLLAFTGNWSAEALSDCGSSGYPRSLDPRVPTNFVHAAQAWQVLIDDPDDFLQAANTVLFSAVIDKWDSLTLARDLGGRFGGRMVHLTKAQCQSLYQFPAGANECAVFLIRNGSEDHNVIGGADLHFAALYALLTKAPEPESLWLPLPAVRNVCAGGGGTGGLSHCTGGWVREPPAEE